VFTKLEKEIILHRLHVPDAIADAFHEFDEPDERGVGDAIDLLLKHFEQGGPLPELRGTVAGEVLWDCIDGSTWMAVTNDAAYSGECTRQHAGRTLAAGNKLAAKVAELTGMECSFPHG